MKARDFEAITPTNFQSPDQLPPAKKWQFTPVYLVLLTAVILAILVLYFVLNAKAVVFRAVPLDAQIEVRGGVVLPIGESRLLLKGAYEVTLNADGYAPLTEELRVDSDTPPEVLYQMTPLPGDLRVRILGAAPESEAGSELLSDRNPQSVLGVATLSGNGLTEPLRIEAPDELLFQELEAGTYQLSVNAHLYSEAQLEVEVPGKQTTHEIEVPLEPHWGWIRFESDPSPVTVFADGLEITPDYPADQDSGSVRTRIDLDSKQIQIVREDYKPIIRDIYVSQDQELDLGLLRLEHVDSKIAVQTNPPGVSVLVNQDYIGETPLVLDLLPDKEHRIELFKAGYQSKRDNIVVEKNSELSLNYRLEPDLVQVSLSLHPANASLKISGKPIAETSGQISLPAVKQQVEVSAPGYETQVLDFLPVRGTHQLLQVRLLTNEQAQWANIPPNYRSALGQELKLFREAGEVSMGSSRRETGRRANEANWTAQLTRPFYVALKEVSNQEYKAFDPEHTSGHFQGVSLDGANQPVINVSWQQAALYCNWLSEQEGLDPFYTVERGFVSGHVAESTGYRLLTEAEWAWLAKMNAAGFPQKYIWGDSEEIPGAVENYADQSTASMINFTLEAVNDGYVTSAPVGSFPPNEKGIYDLSGNVNEWMHDWYQAAPYELGSEVTDPLGPDEGEYHVIRGASWARGYLPQLRLAYRDYDSTGRNDLGFRLARYAM